MAKIDGSYQPKSNSFWQKWWKKGLTAFYHISNITLSFKKIYFLKELKNRWVRYHAFPSFCNRHSSTEWNGNFRETRNFLYLATVKISAFCHHKLLSYDNPKVKHGWVRYLWTGCGMFSSTKYYSPNGSKWPQLVVFGFEIPVRYYWNFYTTI